MKNGRYFIFRDICDRNLWDTGYLVKKLQGYAGADPGGGEVDWVASHPPSGKPIIKIRSHNRGRRP